MKNSQIVCLNPKCLEVPLIELMCSNNRIKIKTDCPFHHYKYDLEEYLPLIADPKKEYTDTCSVHYEKYIGYELETCRNVCRQCLNPKDGKEEIKLFKDIKFSESKESKFTDNYLSTLYSIIYNNFLKAKNEEKLVAGIYINYVYIKTYIKNQPNLEEEINFNKAIFPYKELIEDYNDYPFKLNSRYLIRPFQDKEVIEIFILDKKEYINIPIENMEIKEIELSPFYYDIFLSVSSKEIKIWNILEEGKKIDDKTTIVLVNKSENFISAKFSPLNEKIIITISDNYSIKIWNLEKLFYIHEIPASNVKIKNIIFHPDDESIIGIYSNQKFFIYNINIKKQKYEIKKYNLLYSNFLGSENVFIIDSENFEIYNYNKNQCIYQIQNEYEYCNKYFFKDNLLYIFYNNLKIFCLDNNKMNLVKEMKEIKYNNHDDIIFIENKCQEIKYDILNFIILNKKESLLFSLYINNFSPIITLKELKNNTNYFFKQNKPRLYPVSELSFTQAIYDNNEIFKKKYFDNQELKKELENNYKINLEQKKINVVKKLENYEPEKDLEKEYFQLLSLLIQDNTNKDLIEKYLNFLKENERYLVQIQYRETYKDELDYYKVMFTPEEIKTKLNETKTKELSEKEKFIELLKNLENISDNKYLEFKNNIDKKKLGRFNQKIDFNNKELFWFRNKNLILYSITKLPFEQFKYIQYCIQQVNKLKLFDEEKIIENENRLSFLLINLVIPQSSITYDFNLNLVNSFNIETEEEFKNILKNNGITEMNGKFQFSDGKSIDLDFKRDKDICISNYLLNKSGKINLSNYQLLNYDKIIENFYPKINIEKIRNFLTNILLSNLFKEIFYFFYPDDLIFPFKDKKAAEDFIKHNLNFLPMINDSAHASADKFTLGIYIYLCPKKFYNEPKNFDYSKDENSLLLSGFMTGEIIKSGIHEINHDMYNIYYYHSNGIISLKTPRKMIKNKELRESGREIETIMFGSEVASINIKQALYILNENNYNKGIIDFQKGFIELNDQDLDIEGEFKDFNQIKNSQFFNSPVDFSISTSASNELFAIGAISDNDTL